MSTEKGATYLDKLCHKFYDEPKGHGERTGYVCRICGGPLETYYCEERLYLVKCADCGTLALVKTANPGDSARVTLARPTLTPPPVTGDTSDGYHTFNELYHHRAVLFSVICNSRPDVAWKAKMHHDGTMFDEMFIVGIDTPEGQATYHYDINPYWEMFRVKELEFAPEWDGHTPDEAIRRIGTLTPPNEWVSVEERLPRVGGDFICAVQDKNGGTWTIPAEWNLEMKTWFGAFGEIKNKVTHWMPLPAPPDRRPLEGEA